MPFTLIAEFARFVTKPASAMQITLQDATALELAMTLLYKSWYECSCLCCFAFGQLTATERGCPVASGMQRWRCAGCDGHRQRRHHHLDFAARCFPGLKQTSRYIPEVQSQAVP